MEQRLRASAGTGVVIVAAGRGQRMGNIESDGPKQYRTIGTQSVLAKTVSAFVDHPEIDVVQVVIHPDDHDLYTAANLLHPKLLPPVNGGSTRQESCAIGIFALESHGPNRILIHDAARPFVPAETISKVITAILPGQGALPVHKMADTIKRIQDGRVTETIPREELAAAQTPQGFIYADIKHAHERARVAHRDDFTDDAAVAEWAGIDVKIVEVSADNPKITTPEDLKNANKRMHGEHRVIDIRTGNGYDVHASCPGDHVWLCGLKIPHDRGLKGHSDADVGLHALTDALLGTIGAGDIGSHFPPSDPQWKDASSDQFLLHAMKLLQSSGGTVTNMDVTLICEAPKIGPHRDAMRQQIARITGIDLHRISVKATTNERIGFIGRNEGIAAIATATAGFKPGKMQK